MREGGSSGVVPDEDDGQRVDKELFYAFSHVFSGAIATYQKVRVQNSHYKPGMREYRHGKNTALDQIGGGPCWSPVARMGTDQYLPKLGLLKSLHTTSMT